MDKFLQNTCDAFLAAPFKVDGWESALSNLAKATRSSRAHLLAVGGADEVQLNYLSDIPSDRWDGHFREIDGGNPKINWRLAASAQPLITMSETDYDMVRTRLNSADYDDFVRDYDMVNGCQTALQNRPQHFFGLATLRTIKDGRTTEDDRKTFSLIAPTVLAAIHLQMATEHQASRISNGTLESLDAIAFVCDAHGNVSEWTAKADKFLMSSDNLVISNRRLICRNKTDDARLKHCLSTVTHDGSLDHVAKLWIRDLGTDESGSVLEIYKLPNIFGSFHFAAKAVAIVKRPTALHERSRNLLTDIFDLTKAEAEVAIEIANGAKRGDVAEARNAAISTVHSQLKSIFRKMDVTREAELSAKINNALR